MVGIGDLGGRFVGELADATRGERAAQDAITPRRRLPLLVRQRGAARARHATLPSVRRAEVDRAFLEAVERPSRRLLRPQLILGEQRRDRRRARRRVDARHRERLDAVGRLIKGKLNAVVQISEEEDVIELVGHLKPLRPARSETMSAKSMFRSLIRSGRAARWVLIRQIDVS